MCRWLKIVGSVAKEYRHQLLVVHNQQVCTTVLRQNPHQGQVSGSVVAIAKYLWLLQDSDCQVGSDGDEVVTSGSSRVRPFERVPKLPRTINSEVFGVPVCVMNRQIEVNDILE